jgi:CarboxypepD_reg-like domain
MRSFAVVAIAMLLLPSAAKAQTKSRTITGTVLDSANHKPLSQAVIFLGRTPTGARTGNDGKFRVSADSGPQIIMIRHWGYVPALVVLRDGWADSADAGTMGLRQVKTADDRAAVENLDVQVFPELASFYSHKSHSADLLQLIGRVVQPHAVGSLVILIREKANFQFILPVQPQG